MLSGTRPHVANRKFKDSCKAQIETKGCRLTQAYFNQDAFATMVCLIFQYPHQQLLKVKPDRLLTLLTHVLWKATIESLVAETGTTVACLAVVAGTEAFVASQKPSSQSFKERFIALDGREGGVPSRWPRGLQNLPWLPWLCWSDQQLGDVT